MLKREFLLNYEKGLNESETLVVSLWILGEEFEANCR